MKNLIHTFFTLTTMAVLSAASCKKNNTPPPDNPYGLPDATQTGRNMFACRINSENWVSETGIRNMISGFKTDTMFAYGKGGGDNYFEQLGVEINGNVEEGKIYDVMNKSCSIQFSANKSCLGLLYSNIQNLFASEGTVILTKKDPVNKIISGTFNGKIPFPNCDTLIITDGRFDMKYR